MSDIKDYTPPSDNKLSEPIYAIVYTCPTVALNANTNQIYSSGVLLYRVRKINHTGRVVGYDDGDSIHILGNEMVRGGAIDSGIFGGIKIEAVYNNTATPPRYIAIDDGNWSDSDIAYDDVWNVGVRISSDKGYHPPVKLSAYNYENVNHFNDFFARYFKKGVSGNTLVLTTDPDTTAVTRGLDDVVSGTPTTYFHYDRNIGFYTTAINAIFNSLNKAVVYGNSNPAKDIYYFNPDDWSVTSGSSGTSALYYLNFSNLLITKNIDDAIRYIKDGTIPKDYIYDDPDTSTSATPDGDDNNDSDGNAGSDDRDDISVNLPTADAVSLSNVNIYALTREQLIAFISDMWNFSWTELATNMMTGIYNNLVDNVQSIRVLPFPANDLGVVDTAHEIICGWWTHAATVQFIKTNTAGGAMPRVTAGAYEIKEVFRGWADYSPYTTIDLYLPYHGEERLDTNLFMNHTLKIEYVIDVLMGLITYFISCDNTVVMSLSAKVSADVPVSLASGIDTFTDVLNNSTKFIESASAMRPVGMVTGSTSVATEKLVNQSSQSGMFYMPCKCHVRITRPAYTRASNYASRYGYPCYGSYKLSALKGFTIVENYKGSYSKGIEKEEADEIKRLLEEGVYL